MKNMYAVVATAKACTPEGARADVRISYSFSESDVEAELKTMAWIKDSYKSPGWFGHEVGVCHIPWDKIKAVMAENEAGLTNNET